MTVCYSSEVATARPFGFVRLLFRWRGSFYKLIFFQFGVYFIIYNTLNLVYMFLLNDQQRMSYNEVGRKFGRLSAYIVGPIIFCLGFFIQQVYKRFCDHFQEVPWPDALAFLISAYVRGHDKKSRQLRRTMVRYGVASIVLALMSVSERMQAIFPSLDLVVVSGFLSQDEADLLVKVKISSRHMVVLGWCSTLFRKARINGWIEDDFGYNAMIEELDNIRFKCRRLVLYDWVSVPLAYVHTVIIGLHSFFMAAAISSIYLGVETQRLHKEVHKDGKIPIADQWGLRLLAEVITFIQFTICAGMLATSQALIRPFGKNDGNIDVDQIVKRHLSIAYIIVDDLFAVIPELNPENIRNNPLGDLSMDDLALTGFQSEVFKTQRKSRGSIFFRRTSQDLTNELREAGIVFQVGSEQEDSRTWRWLRHVPVLNMFMPRSSSPVLDHAISIGSLEQMPKMVAVENQAALHRILSFRRLN